MQQLQKFEPPTVCYRLLFKKQPTTRSRSACTQMSPLATPCICS